MTVPPHLRDEVASKITTIPAGRRLTEACAEELFGDRVLRVIGPAYQGAVDLTDFKPFTRHATRRLTPSDRGLLATLLSECDPTDIEHSGVCLDSVPLHGCFRDGKIVAVAKEIDLSPCAMGLGILTHPAFRGQGYGKAAVSAAVTAILVQGKVVCYQTLVRQLAVCLDSDRAWVPGLCAPSCCTSACLRESHGITFKYNNPDCFRTNGFLPRRQALYSRSVQSDA